MAYGISFIQYFGDYHPQEAKEPAKKAEQTKGQFFGISFGVSFVLKKSIWFEVSSIRRNW